MRMVMVITKSTMMRYSHGNNCDDETTRIRHDDEANRGRTER